VTIPTSVTSATRPNTTLIKICGIRSVEMAAMAVEAGADAIGMVIDVPGSPRTLTLDEAEAIAATLPPRIMKIAVIRNGDPQMAARWHSTWVQLHGDEDEQTVAGFARTKHVMRGFRFDVDEVLRWDACPDVDILLIDGSTGGTGESFRHDQLAALMPKITKPVVLAGGLTPDNVADAIATVRPFAVDVSSGVESAPGVKDADLIAQFCDAVRAEKSAQS